MNRSGISVFVSGIAVNAIAALSVASAQAPQMPGPELPQLVTAGGTGQIRVAPAGARVTIAVEARAATASAAGIADAAKMARLLEALRHAGFGPRDISTSSFSLDADRDYGKDGPIDRGYLLTNAVVVTVKDLTRLNVVVDSAIAGGATKISNVDFFVSSPDSAAHVALALAVANARSAAEIMADAAGGRLGQLYDVSNTSGSVVIRGLNSFEASSRAYFQVVPLGTSIHVEDVPVSAGVIARWRFIPK